MKKTKKKYYGILIAVILALSVGGVFGWFQFFASSPVEAVDTEMQLSHFHSFDEEIVDVKLGNLDSDDQLEMLVARESRLGIFKESDEEFEKIWEIETTEDEFFDADSTISALAIGDVIGRSSIPDLNQVSGVDSSENCTILNSPADITYLKNRDNLTYELEYDAEANGNFTVDLDVTGITPTSFDLEILMNHSLAPDTANLSIYNNEVEEWDQWENLTAISDIDDSPTNITIPSDDLPSSLNQYITADKNIEIGFIYNDTEKVNVSIDYIDLTNISIASRSDVIVGSSEGDLAILQCIDDSENDYEVLSSLDQTFYDSNPEEDEGGDEYSNAISTILTGDLNNDGSDEFIIGNNWAKIYAINHTSGDAFEELGLGSRNAEKGIEWELEEPSTIDPGEYNRIKALNAIDLSDGNFTLFIGTRENFYTIDYVIGSGWSESYPQPVTILDDAEITDISIIAEESAGYQIVLGMLGREFHIYNILGTNYTSNTNYEQDWGSGDLISSGNWVTKFTSGDYAEEGKNSIAIASTQSLDKVQMLSKESNYNVNWQSKTYIRESITGLETISRSKQDSLVVISSRRVYIYSNWDYKSTDGTGLSDLGQLLYYDTDPDDPDTDGDGLNDAVEIYYYGTDPLEADTDGDLVSDGLEVRMGTDYNDPMSSIIIILLVPTIIALAAISILIAARRYIQQRRAEYEKVKSTPNLMPQIRRLIIQRLESFNKEFKGFSSKKEMSKFKNNLSTELMSIVLDRLYNFLEYLRLKGIIFTDREEEILKEIVQETMEPVQEDIDELLETLLSYETRYKQFQKGLAETLDKYQDWKQPATKAKGKVKVEDLIECPKCGSLQPKDSAFCLECGEKIVKQ
ncbi:MAG: hypothetical protein R6U96_08715 [Promethearchaeia archaeon]